MGNARGNTRCNAAFRARPRMPFVRVCALIGALSIASPACAQSSSNSQAPPAATSPAPSQTTPSPQLAPPNASNNLPTACDAFSHSQLPSPTLVSTRITADGDMRDPTVFKSSGDDALDKAALACADGFHFGPISVGGRPTEVTWVIGFFAHWSHFIPASPSGDPHICGARWFPPSAVRRGENGEVVVSYRITVDGNITELAVTQSSGAKDLDQAALNCVSSWRFFPVKQNGEAVEVQRSNKISFLTR
jgi:TonB family protein